MKKISMIDLLTTSGKYRERALSQELTPEVIKNGEDTLERVNGFLEDLYEENKENKDLVKILEVKELSSGFRPSDVNSGVANAAKKSPHKVLKAIDLLDDKNQTLGICVRNSPHLLKKWGLMVEDISATKGKFTNWVHLDTVQRSFRESMMFKP